jgi:hypothetical protein
MENFYVWGSKSVTIQLLRMQPPEMPIAIKISIYLGLKDKNISSTRKNSG